MCTFTSWGVVQVVIDVQYVWLQVLLLLWHVGSWSFAHVSTGEASAGVGSWTCRTSGCIWCGRAAVWGSPGRCCRCPPRTQAPPHPFHPPPHAAAQRGPGDATSTALDRRTSFATLQGRQSLAALCHRVLCYMCLCSVWAIWYGTYITLTLAVPFSLRSMDGCECPQDL